MQAQSIEPGEPPDIYDDYYVLPRGTTRLVARPGVLDNDSLPRSGWRAQLVRPPEAGKLNRWNERDGTFTYEVGDSWNGSDHFDYKVLLDGQSVGSGRVTIGTGFKGYTYYLDSSGTATRETGRHGKGGFLLMGGVARQPELDTAFSWLIQQGNGHAPADGDNSRGCRVLIIAARASQRETTGAWMRHVAERRHLRLHSVETLIFNSWDVPAARHAARHDPFVRQKLNEADVVFMPGGDQLAYVDLWGDSQIQEVLNRRMAQGALVVGGSSAGLHVMGEAVSIPLRRQDVAANVVAGRQGISSYLAIESPDRLGPMLHWDFLQGGLLYRQRVLTDSHFGQRNPEESEVNLRGRMGRLVAFMAWMAHERPGTRPVHGLGVDETTALMVDPGGKSTVAGKSCVYFVTAAGRPPHFGKEAGRTRLTWEGLQVVKVRAGGVFDLEQWQLIRGGEQYSISVRAGKLVNDRGDSRDVYNAAMTSRTAQGR